MELSYFNIFALFSDSSCSLYSILITVSLFLKCHLLFLYFLSQHFAAVEGATANSCAFKTVRAAILMETYFIFSGHCPDAIHNSTTLKILSIVSKFNRNMEILVFSSHPLPFLKWCRMMVSIIAASFKTIWSETRLLYAPWASPRVHKVWTALRSHETKTALPRVHES